MTIVAPLDAPAVSAPLNGLLTSPILPTLLRLALPNTVAMFGSTLVAVAETSYIGRLGIEPLAAIALVFPFAMLTQMMSAGAMGGGVSSAISRALGAGDRDRAASLALHAAIIGVGGGLFFTVMMLVFGRQFFMILGGRGQVLEQACDYSHVLFSGAVAIWLVNTLASVLRGTGDMSLPSAILIAAAMVQIIVGGTLGLGLFGLPQFGMRGVAAGQLTAFALGAAFLLWYLASGRSRLRLKFSAFRFQRGMFIDILKVGAIACLSPLQSVLTILIFTKILAGFGTETLAGYGMGARLEFLLTPVAFAHRRCLRADGGHGDRRRPYHACAPGRMDRRRRGRLERRPGWMGGGGQTGALGIAVHRRPRRHRRRRFLFRMGGTCVWLFRGRRLPLFRFAGGGEGWRSGAGVYRTAGNGRDWRMVAGLDRRTGLDAVRPGRRGHGRAGPRHRPVRSPGPLG